VSRAIEAIAKAPKVSAGSTRLSQPSRPEVGRSPRFSETIRIRRMPMKNVGADWPMSASPIVAWSMTEFRFTAETTPIGSATSSARVNAARPSSNVAGR
jgi:hypothetical protein